MRIAPKHIIHGDGGGVEVLKTNSRGVVLSGDGCMNYF